MNYLQNHPSDTENSKPRSCTF